MPTLTTFGFIVCSLGCLMGLWLIWIIFHFGITTLGPIYLNDAYNSENTSEDTIFRKTTRHLHRRYKEQERLEHEKKKAAK